MFLLPSESESFGLAALEALACGVPVVGTTVGGLPEVVLEDAGALVPVGDVGLMAEKALAMLRDPARLRALRDAAVRSAARYSADRIVPMYEDLYRRTLAS